MKKKILTIGIVVIIAISAITGASLAYLTDDDSARNVMTIGSVKIEQNEQERDANGALPQEKNSTNFVQNKTMVPAVFTETIDATNIITQDATTGERVFNPAIKNVVDKFVTITNKGNQSVFARTIIAFEGTYEEHNKLVYVNGTYDYIKNADGNVVEITLKGTTYCLAVCYYDAPIASLTTSATSLRQVFFAPHATNDDMTQFGKTYDILCISQAVQVAGFEELGAEFALNTSFGDIAANAATWFEGIAN